MNDITPPQDIRDFLAIESLKMLVADYMESGFPSSFRTPMLFRLGINGKDLNDLEMLTFGAYHVADSMMKARQS